MKLNYTLLLFSLSALFLSSCSTPSYFVPAAAGNDIAYLPKPMESDSVKTKNYISASIAGLSLPYSTGDLNMGFLNFSRGYTFKNINIGYGAFGFAGSTSYDSSFYGEENEIEGFDGKGIFGGGIRSSIGYYDNAGNAEFRILSWENALSFENGNYSKFRNTMFNLNDPNIISTTKTTLYTTGISSEIIWHPKKNLNNHYAIRLFYGFTPGLNNSFNRGVVDEKPTGGAFSSSFYFKLRKFYGIIETGANKGGSAKFSLGYAF